MAEVSERLKSSSAVAADELKALLRATNRQYEVEVAESAWADYLRRKNLSEPAPEEKSKSGRPEKVGWRALSVIIGAYIIKHYQTTNEQIKVEEASEKIHEIAKADNIPDLPAAPTIKEVLSKIRWKAETLSIN